MRSRRALANRALLVRELDADSAHSHSAPRQLHDFPRQLRSVETCGPNSLAARLNRLGDSGGLGQRAPGLGALRAGCWSQMTLAATFQTGSFTRLSATN